MWMMFFLLCHLLAAILTFSFLHLDLTLVRDVDYVTSYCLMGYLKVKLLECYTILEAFKQFWLASMS